MTEVATREEKPVTVAQAIAKYYPLYKEALPKQVDAERFKRLALTTLRKTPRLQGCSPESFTGSLLVAAALGLEPDVNGECYLVPYGKEAQLIVGYQGIAKLFWQNPLAQTLIADYVCENDEFEYSKGLNPTLHHVPARSDRGKVIYYYAIVGLNSGARWFDVFTPNQIRILRRKGENEKRDIADPEHWMERKTALKQVLKLAPKSTQLVQAMAVDERVGSMSVMQVIADGGTPDAPPVDVVDGELVDPETGEVAS